MNSHYIPRFILKNFADENGQLSLAYTDDRPIEHGRSIKTVCAEEGYYSDKLEKLIANKIEGPFADFLINKLLPAKNHITLTRDELILTKVYCIIQLIRKFVDEKQIMDSGFGPFFIQKMVERQEEDVEIFLTKLLTVPDFEKQIASFIESQFDKIMQLGAKHALTSKARALNQFTYNTIVEHIYFGYLAIWDSKLSKTNFILPDIGYSGNFFFNYQGGSHFMQVFNAAMTGYVSDHELRRMTSSCEYYILPVSKTRALVFLHPFFLNFYHFHRGSGVDEYIGCGIPDMIRPPKHTGITKKEYRYPITQLPYQDVVFQNRLFLNEAHTYVIFQTDQELFEMLDRYEEFDDSGNKNHFCRT